MYTVGPDEIDPHTLATAVELAYGLRVAKLEVASHSKQRLVVRIVDEAGATYGLKRRPPWITSRDFHAVRELQRRARAGGARLPAVVSTRDGNLVWGWRGYELSMHVWVDGVPLKWDVTHARGLGAAVGAFTLASRSLEAPQAGDWEFPSGRGRWLPDTPAQLRLTTRYLDVEVFPQSIVTAIDSIAAQAEQAVTTIGLATGFIHGDISPLNAVWGSGEATLIDFDEMRWGYRLFDAAQGAAIIGGTDPGEDGAVIRTEWEAARLQAFLAGWASEACPSYAERLAFPSLLQLALLRVTIGELDLDDPNLSTRYDAASAIETLLDILHEPPPELI